MNKKKSSLWNSSAESYNNFIGKNGDPIRSKITDPVLFSLLKNIRNKTVLDAGCGNGYLCQKINQKKPKKTVGIDFSEKLISLAKENFPKLDFQKADLTKKLPFKNETFDIIISNFVLMDIPEIKTTIKEFKRTLKPKGQLIISILHPCFSPPVSSWKRRFLGRINYKYSKLFFTKYFNQKEHLNKIKNSSCKSTKIYHRTLEEYSNILSKNNFYIKKLLEPQADQSFINDYPNYYQFHLFPVALILDCEKE